MTPTPSTATPRVFDFAAMTEEEQIAYAMQLSLQGMQDSAMSGETDLNDGKEKDRTVSGASVGSAMETDTETEVGFELVQLQFILINLLECIQNRTLNSIISPRC